MFRGLRLRSAVTVALGSMLTVALGTGASAAGGALPGRAVASFGTTAGLANLPPNTRLYASAVNRDGTIVTTGQRTTATESTLLIARLTRRGRLDGRFRGGIMTGPTISEGTVRGSVGRAIAVQVDGKYVVAGRATDPSAIANNGMLVERFNRDGTLDTRFGIGGVVRLFVPLQGSANTVTIQRDGKIVVGGSADAPDAGDPDPFGTRYQRVALARLQPDGSLDPGFGIGGTAILQLGRLSVANALAIDRTGGIIVAGSQRQDLQTTNALLARVLPNGSLDSSFATGGASIVQYASEGGGYSAFQGVDIQRDGRIVAAGADTGGSDVAQALFARFTAAGRADSSFAGSGVVKLAAARDFGGVGAEAVPGNTGVRVLANGTIIGAGTFANSGLSELATWALTPRGDLATNFADGGITRILPGPFLSGEVNGIAIAPGGDVVLAGASHNAVSPYRGLVARLSAIPTLDAAAPGVTLSAPHNTIVFGSNGRAVVTLSNSNATTVRGTLGATATRQPRVAFATAKFSIPAHRRVRVTLRLSRARLARLSGAGRVPVRTILSLRDAYGNRATVRKSFYLATR